MLKLKKSKSPIWSITISELQKLVDKSKSYCELVNYFGLKSKGGNNLTLHKRLKQDKIDLSKFIENKIKYKKEIATTRGRTAKKLEDILIENSDYNRTCLKKRLLKEGILKNECYECKQLPIWNGKPLSLQLDHKNGISNDNRLFNLRLICPNCHSQTPTFAGKRHKKVKIRVSDLNPNWRHQPRLTRRKIDRPDRDFLNKLIWEKPTTHIAKEYGVSDKAVSKWVVSYGLSKPPRGYWTKHK